MRRLWESCSWCGRMNVVSVSGSRAATLCEGCGHRADLPRMACDCSGCVQAEALLVPDAAGEVWEAPS